METNRRSQVTVSNLLASFKELPPRHTPASFTIGQVMEKLQETASN
jgi:hypothetical protein